MNGASKLPTEIEHLTAEWFSEVLGRDVVDATVVDRSSGTTGRARVLLRGEPGVPESVFVKLPPFDEQQRAGAVAATTSWPRGVKAGRSSTDSGVHARAVKST